MFSFINVMVEKIKNYFHSIIHYDAIDSSNVFCNTEISLSDEILSEQEISSREVVCEQVNYKDNNQEIAIEAEKAKDKLPENLSNMKFGTVVWANRYKTEKERIRLGTYHQNGPYIVVGRYTNNLVCLYGTGTHPKKNNYIYRHLLKVDKIDEWTELKQPSPITKNTYFDTCKLHFLDASRIILEVGVISNIDIELLNRKLAIQKLYKRYAVYGNKINFINPKVTLDSGCLLSKDSETYFIYNTTDDHLEAFRISKVQDNSYNSILIGQKYYHLDFEQQKIFQIDEKDFLLTGLISPEQSLVILKKMKKYFEKKLPKEKIKRESVVNDNNDLHYVYGEEGNEFLAFQVSDNFNEEKKSLVIGKTTFYTTEEKIKRGSVVNDNNDLYYVYGEEGNEFLAFQVSNKFNEEKKSLVIGKTTFYTTFNKEIKIEKDDTSNYTVITSASEWEMDEVKKIKKDYKKNQKEKKSKTKKTPINSPSIVDGVIFETNTLARDRYLVLKRTNDMADCIFIDDLFEENPIIETVLVSKVRRIGRIQKQELEQIKTWITDNSQPISEEVKTKIKSI